MRQDDGMRPRPEPRGEESECMEWEVKAQARLEKAPFFVRPFIKLRAEREAKSRGLTEVSEALLDELKGREHKG